MTLKRLEAIRDHIWSSHGWKDGCSPEELQWIKNRWEKLPENYTFYDAVCWCIRNWEDRSHGQALSSENIRNSTD